MKTGLPPGTPTKTLLEASGDLSVQQMIAFTTLSTCHQIIRTGKPMALSRKFQQGLVLTRQGFNIRIEANLTLSRGAFFYRAAMLFNNLPRELRDEMLSNSFKGKMKKWIQCNIPVKPS